MSYATRLCTIFMCSAGVVQGVVCNGDSIKSPLVVSGAGAPITLMLCGEEAERIPWAQMPKETEREDPKQEEKGVAQGISHMSCFVGLEGTSAELELNSRNIWNLPEGEGDLGDACHQYYKDGVQFDNDNGPMTFFGSPSAKDPTWNLRHPGKSVVVIISEARMEWFTEWEKGTKAGSRGSSYENVKNVWKDYMLNVMYELYPKTKGKVVYSSIGSPLSNQHYYNRAASYGMEPTPKRFAGKKMQALRPKVDGVEGLYIVGQDLTTPGWAGALTSALLTSMAILGYGFFDLAVLNRDLEKELEELGQVKVNGKKTK
eukprot:m.272496 g.272496  ORF g.272496 m.272496 type:complete len:316 (-) comp16271_c2_seq5:97-1044(-)